MAKKEKNSDKKLTKEEKKLKKQAKAEKQHMIEENIGRFVNRLTDKQNEIVSKFLRECEDDSKKMKRYLNELTDEKEKELIREAIGVLKGKIQLKPIGARDIANIWKRQNSSLFTIRPMKQIRERPIRSYKPVTPGYSDSKPDNQPYKPYYDKHSKPAHDEPQRNEPQRDEPQHNEPQRPVIDEKLFDELDKHSDEINKYLDGV